MAPLSDFGEHGELCALEMLVSDLQYRLGNCYGLEAKALIIGHETLPPVTSHCAMSSRKVRRRRVRSTRRDSTRSRFRRASSRAWLQLRPPSSARRLAISASVKPSS